MNDGPKLERIPDFYIEPVNLHLDDWKTTKAKVTSFSDEAQKKKRRKSAFNKHPSDYSDVYDIHLINEDSPSKNSNDQIKRQLLGLNKKSSSIEKTNSSENQFGNEKERLQNQLNDLLQSQMNIQTKAEREKRFNEDKAKQLQALINETNLDDFYELHAISLKKKKQIVEFETQIQNKEKEKLREQKEYYDEINKAISLKNLLIKEIKEMIEIAKRVPSFKEGGEYIDPIELIKANYLIPDESQEDIIDDHIGIATEINKTNVMPAGLNEDSSMPTIQMNATEKYFFDINNNNYNSKVNLDRIERTKATNRNMVGITKKQQVIPMKSQSQPQTISNSNRSSNNKKKEEAKPKTVLMRDIYRYDDL